MASESARGPITDSQVIQQLEKIARAIRALEGMPVEYRLAMKLSHLLQEIAEYCAPSGGE